MQAKATYLGENKALLHARYGQGEKIVNTDFILEDVKEDKEAGIVAVKKNEPKKNAEIFLEIDANARGDENLSQEELYNKQKSEQKSGFAR